MSTELLIRLVACALTVCFAGLLLKRDNPLGAFLITAAFCAVALCSVLPVLGSLLSEGRTLLTDAGLNTELFSPLLKVLGISVCTRIATEMCKDAGQSAVAAKLELCGAVSAVLCALPLAKRVLALIGTLS